MSREEFVGQTGGGGIADFTLKITGAEFKISAEYSEKSGAPTVFCHWYGQSDVEGHELMGSEGFHPSFSLHPDFVSPDGGKTITEQSGKRRKYGKNYGRLLEAVNEMTAHLADTPNDPLWNKDRHPLPPPAGIIHPRYAESWVGHKFRMDNVDVDFGGQIGQRTFLLPVEYLGYEGVTAAPVAAAPVAAPVTAAPTAAAPAASAGEALMMQLQALANAATNYADFQKAALAVPGVSPDSGLLLQVADQQNGIWAGRG